MERKNSKQGERKFVRKDGDEAKGGRRGGSAGRGITRGSIPKDTVIEYKNIAFLQKCLTERGKIVSRRISGADAKQARLISVAVKRARYLGLLAVGSSKRK